MAEVLDKLYFISALFLTLGVQLSCCEHNEASNSTGVQLRLLRGCTEGSEAQSGLWIRDRAVTGTCNCIYQLLIRFLLS